MRFWKIIILYFLFVPSVCLAETKRTEVIHLEQVIANVLEHNPEILAGDLQSRVALEKIRQAKQATSPMSVNVEIENFAGSGEFSGVQRIEGTLSMTRVLELGGKTEMRTHVARQQAHLLSSEQDAKKLDLLAEATRRFIRVALLQQKLDIAVNKLALVKSIQAINTKRIRLGKSPKAEQRRIKIELERAKLELEHVEHELKTSLVRLSAMWGSTSPAFNTVRAELFVLDKPGAFVGMVDLLDKNPDIVMYASQQRLAQARINLAKTRKRADIEITGGIRHFRQTSDSALVLSAKIPLGASSRARPYIEEANILAQQTPHKLAQRRVELHAELYDLYQEILHAYEAVKVLRKIIIPEAKLVLRDYKRGYKLGRYSLLEFNNAQKTLLDAQLEAAVMASNFHRNKIEIERLTGANLQRLGD